MAYVQWLWNDSATMEAVGGTHKLCNDAARRWFAKVVDPGGPSHCYFLIYDADDKPIGEVSSHRMDLQTRVAEFNIKVQASHRGRGYGSEALRVFFKHYFLVLEARGIDDPLALENLQGRKILEDFGFVQDLSVKDAHMMRLSRERYLDLHSVEEG
ncbi:GNAT family N-acetyltransferase [bacterium]|nr:GNAT family N-acetyltransferase [bacterium]